jgi:glutamyl-tRNA reductase
MSSLVLIGLSHRTAEVGIRERAAFPDSGLPESLHRLVRRSGIHEAMIISTCNRVEILSHAEDSASGIQCLREFINETSRIPLPQLQKNLYAYSDEQAVRHVFRVASSLDSMILGEPQILGQIKSFYTIAVEAGTVGSRLNALLQAAFKAAKRVRSETSIGEYSVSVSSAAVELGRKILGDLRRKSILIIGAGKMGEMALKHLAASGARTIRVVNRSAAAAEELAAKFNGIPVPYAQMRPSIEQSDIVIVSTGAPDYLITPELAKAVMLGRKSEPILFVDISVPRNVDPEVAAVDNIFCYDIDDLGAVVEANLQERQKEAIEAEKIVEQEAAALVARLKSMEVGPVVVELQGRIEEICKSELQRFLKRAGPRDEKETRELEFMIGRIAGKIAHPLVTQLRVSHPDPSHQKAYLDTIRRIFNIQNNGRS